MKALAIKLKPRGPFHFGERGVGIEETEALAHSDTIFSALCWAWTLLFGEGELEKLLGRFLDNQPPFLISSALPYAGEALFLPRPLAVKGRDEEEIRRLKRVKYISLGIYKLLLAGSLPRKPVLIQEGHLWLTEEGFEGLQDPILAKDELRDFLREWASLGKTRKPEPIQYARCYRLWRIGEVPHVAVDRVTSASNIFHEGDVRFAEGCGMYILVRFLDEGVRDKFLAAMRLLGDEGLGGRRSAGRGFFEVERAEEVEIPEAADGNRAVLLSLLNPREGELSALLSPQDAAYRLVARRGWVYSARARNLRRKRVMMFAEGSVLGLVDGGFAGRMVNVLPRGGAVPHDVYRYGYGLFVRFPKPRAEAQG